MLRIGLLDNLEFQAVTSPIIHREVSFNGGPSFNQNGWGDTVLRLKDNLVGNHGEEFGVAIIPYIKLATNTDDLGNNSTEGGVNGNVSSTFSLNYTLQLGYLKQDDNTGHTTGVGHAVGAKQYFSDKLYGFFL
jgi:hypothetical protein